MGPLVFLINAFIEIGAPLVNLIGIANGLGAIAMFPEVKDEHGLLTAEVGSLALIAFNLPYLLTYLFPPTHKRDTLNLSLGGALYHYAIVAQTVYRLIRPGSLPVVGPSPEVALTVLEQLLGRSVEVAEARFWLGATIVALHLPVACWFVVTAVDAIDDGRRGKGEEGEPLLEKKVEEDDE
ncbi:hypothetical protein HDU96_000707 [Phlyctochytrium bullatum]|nr:hypothetical protein HDU96_000707 [Phlyctochytrium bullatum]